VVPPHEPRLIRMDKAMPFLFHTIEERLNLRDGFVTTSVSNLYSPQTPNP
jgi:hypothetical protein